MEEKNFLENISEIQKIIDEQKQLENERDNIEFKIANLRGKLIERKELFFKYLKKEVCEVDTLSNFLKQFNEYYNKHYLSEDDYLELLITFLRKFKYMCYTEHIHSRFTIQPSIRKWKRILLINESERTLKKKLSIYNVYKKSAELRFSNDGRGFEWLLLNDKIFLSNDKEETKLFMEMQNNF